ncbi:MAG TPA: histidinol dehydrogenase [Thermoanaerobaculia bacterium]|nr:histidinol dehydrogenase [Thermoanaerobaculia bacterium]
MRTGVDDVEAWISSIETRRRSQSTDSKDVAAAIIEQVSAGGDRVVAELVERFDKVAMEPAELKVAPRDTSVEPELKAAIDMAIARIEYFHSFQKSEGYEFTLHGSTFVHQVKPLNRVGIYVPGGRAVYLSTLIMCAVPARLAGVREIVVATTFHAAERNELHYACQQLGIREIYRSGGAAAIAAMTRGTESLRRVDKIVGPGNRFVAAAKQLLSEEVGIDMTAGPSEIIVIGDSDASAELIAADLVAQAEHGEDSSAICVTDSERLGLEVVAAVARQLEGADTHSAAPRSIAEHGAVVITGTIEEAAELANRLAPEHLEIQTRSARTLLDRIHNCGSVFLGGPSGVAFGDYIAGPNHVLPTAGTARFFSPLGVYDFYKRQNVISLSNETVDQIGSAGEKLASLEGLPLHARSIAARREGR